MGLFSKKKKTEAEPVVKGPASSGKAAVKKASGMSEILHESVVETAIDKFKGNDAFIRYEHGMEKYVGIVLDTKDIGGLDKKSRKDEAKGSLIECINSGRIQTYITMDLMDHDMLCLIPDAGTLAAMNEFSILTNAPYEFCQVDENGDIELLGVKTTFDQIADLVADDGRVDSLLSQLDEPAKEEDDDDFFDDGGVAMSKADAPVNTTPADDDDDIPDADDIPEADDIPQEEDGSISLDAEAMSFDDDSDIDADSDVYQQAMAEEPPEQEVPGDFSDEVVVRTFYSGDLGLEVTSEPFDAQFMQNNGYEPFDTDRGDGWINQQLNEMSRAANTEMAHMHKENQWQMRERYFKLVSLACDRIRNDLDVHNPETQYGQMYQSIQDDKQASLETMDRRIQRRKDEIESNWRQRLQEVGLEAARAAQHQYRERYGKQRDMSIYNIEATERAAIDAEYQDALHELYDRRKKEASALLDLTITDILDEVSDMYMVALQEERVRYQELDSDMRRFVEENRQNDIARSQALAEELRQSDKADKVLAEQTAKMQNLSEEYKQKREQLYQEMEDIRTSNAQRIALMKQEREDDQRKWDKERKVMDEKYDELLARYQQLDAAKEKEFSSRFQEMKDENDALADRNDHLMEVHKRSNLISIFLVVSIAIAALCIGFIGGQFINTQQRTALEQQEILEEYGLTDGD